MIILLCFSYDEEVLKNYFPLYRVMNGLFSLCNRLFGVKIQESTDVDVWHGDVKFFYVYEPNNDSPVGGFYFDPYVRYQIYVLHYLFLYI